MERFQIVKKSWVQSVGMVFVSDFDNVDWKLIIGVLAVPVLRCVLSICPSYLGYD